MPVRRYEPGDWNEWLRMNIALFPGFSRDEGEAEMRACLARSDAAVFVLERAPGEPLAGYVEVGTRAYAEGCDTSPVGYIEAWYVDPDVRRGGYGRALLEAAEAWAREQGYSEIASDTLLDNHLSQAAHERSGYSEVERLVAYRKDLR